MRYVALARLLGPTELGLATTLVVTGAFFDLVSDTGSDRFLIQDRDGDTPQVQRLVQLVYVLRGFAIAVALAAFSIPIAAFFRAPRLAGGLAVLGLSPLILGFLNLDIRRSQRHLDFRPEAVAILTAESLSLVATVIAALVIRDFTATLYGLITRALVMVLVSHITARRRYSLGYDKEIGRRLRSYSGPLMLTGVMLFVGMQGDRVMAGRALGLRMLGQYSAVLQLIYYPSTMLLRYTHNLYMPLVAACRDDAIERERVSESLGGMTFLMAIAMAVGFSIVAPPMITVLFGSRYRATALLVGMIGVLQTTRFLINWPTTVAMSMGRSRTVLANNLPRLLVFPGALIGLWLVGGLLGMVVGFAAGEMVSIIVAVLLLNRNMGRSWHAGFDRLTMFIAAAALIGGWNIALESRATGPMGGLLILSLGLFVWIYRREHLVIRELWLMIRIQLRRFGLIQSSSSPPTPPATAVE